jgi:hypothetical protein
MVIAGEAMVSDGGPEGEVVTGVVITGGVDAACMVTAIEADAESPAVSVARIAIVLTPTTSGTDATDQVVDPAAGPEPPWLLLQTTCRLPVPPLAVPEMEIDDAVVVRLVAAGLTIVRLSAVGAGSEGGGVTGVTGDVGASGLPYRACTPAISPLESPAPKR